MKLCFCDIDHTILESGIEITNTIKEAFIKLQENGYTIVLSSARIAGGIYPIAKAIELDQRGGYVIACNGSFIYDMKQQKVIYGKTIPINKIKDFVSFVTKTPMHISCEQETYVVLSGLDQGASLDIENCKIDYVLSDTILPELKRPVYKCSVTGEKELLDQYFNTLKEYAGSSLGVYRSTDEFIDIIDPDCNKLASMKWLMNYLNVEQKDTAAIGDGTNDAYMIEYANIGAAVENAKPLCKEVADFIVPSYQEEGFIVFADRLMKE